jgi:hypothetical protein
MSPYIGASIQAQGHFCQSLIRGVRQNPEAAFGKTNDMAVGKRDVNRSFLRPVPDSMQDSVLFTLMPFHFNCKITL